MKRLLFTLVTLSLLLCLGPVLDQHISFAVTYFDHPQVGSGDSVTQLPSSPVIQNEPVSQQKAQAPEPSTLILVLGGIGSIIVRFARKSFDKFKRATDVALSIFGLVIVSPILAFAAAMIKLNSRGPLLYKQKRVGKEDEVFEIYKLRTMRVDAEKDTGAVWAKENDPRITSVGRILRKAHIDEIPQLINVLKGDMSIVGPRPERPEMVRDFKTLIYDYEKRLQIKPGITGLAQVYHKYDETIEDVKKKIKYDILYIKKMCLLVDLRIMARTFTAVLTGRGAR
ncbi:MAG: hypothetical protein A2166_00315 [Omnitrophica WOR_2 bacterium RBG_13_41_10]|nr:MAG: hypothetical protein A2166_00315 [Omnitrophica WOR_2 bacterium RBG_13_41_10]